MAPSRIHRLWLFGSMILIPIHADKNTGCNIDDLDQNNSGSLIAAFVLIYVLCIVSALIIMFYLARFYRADKSGNPVIRNRRPRLVYALNMLVVGMNLLLFPIAIEFWTLECVTNTQLLRTSSHSINTIQSTLFIGFISVIYGWLILIVLRVWLLRYDYSASRARKREVWRKDLEIDGSAHATWWIEHQRTWGSESYLLRLVSIPFILAVALSTFLSPIFDELHGMKTWNAMTISVALIAIILCCFIVVNVLKVREILDNFHIKYEILWFAKTSVTIGSVLLLAFIILQFGGGDWIVMVWSLLVMLMLTVVSYIQTGWILIAIERKKEKTKELLTSIKSHWETNISLYTVLQSKEGFEVFMDFLVSEYSTENLLCYIEFTQFLRKWQHVIYKLKMIEQRLAADEIQETDRKLLVAAATEFVNDQMESGAESNDEMDQQPWSFHHKDTVNVKFEWVKKPALITDEDITLYLHFCGLRDKYISSTSGHQVNISSNLYRAWSRIKEEQCDLNQIDLCELFHDGTLTASSPRSPGSRSSPFQFANSSPDSAAGSLIHAASVPMEALSRETTDSTKSLVDVEPENVKTPTISDVMKSQGYNNMRRLEGVAKVMHLVADTRRELWKNMNDSYRRFRQTENYVNYIRKVYRQESRLSLLDLSSSANKSARTLKKALTE